MLDYKMKFPEFWNVEILRGVYKMILQWISTLNESWLKKFLVRNPTPKSSPQTIPHFPWITSAISHRVLIGVASVRPTPAPISNKAPLLMRRHVRTKHFIGVSFNPARFSPARHKTRPNWIVQPGMKLKIAIARACCMVLAVGKRPPDGWSCSGRESIWGVTRRHAIFAAATRKIFRSHSPAAVGQFTPGIHQWI